MVTEEVYRDIINPENLIKGMDAIELNKWLGLAECKEDLESTLAVFEKHEMYEECSVILKFLENNFELS